MKTENRNLQNCEKNLKITQIKRLPKIKIKQFEQHQITTVNKSLQINIFDIENFTSVSQSFEFQRLHRANQLNKNRDYCSGRYAHQLKCLSDSHRYSQNHSINYWAKIVYHQSRQNADKIFQPYFKLENQ